MSESPGPDRTAEAPVADAVDDAFLLHFARTAFLPDRPDVVGAAVSGGSDSMAMLHLLAEAGWAVRAVTVDHGLRPESADEARRVAEACARLDVPHAILRWQHGGRIEGNLQDAARRARYGLIARWARTHEIGHVAVAHTADDQAETFLMELAREAGLDGLSSMRRTWEQGGVRWYRPFLAQSRADLRAYLARRELGWIDDPSNQDQRFQRVRARLAMKALTPLGITAGKLASVALHLSLARQGLDWAVTEEARRISSCAAGEVVFDRPDFRALPPEIARRLLIGALRWIAGEDYPPRGPEIARLVEAIRAGRHATLAGCRIRVEDRAIRIHREARAVAGLSVPVDEPFDGRWVLEGPYGSTLAIRPLGEEGLQQCPDWRATGASRGALIASPAVWRGADLVAAPVAGLPEGWSARLLRSFAEALAPH